MFQYASLLRLASVASVLVAFSLIIAKAVAWIYTDSLSLQASLVDSLLDIIASIINFFVIRQALKPADEDHRFGHGKAEALGSLAQTTFILGSALWLFFDVFHRVAHPQPIYAPEWGIMVMLFATILTTALVAFQKYVVRLTGSVAIAADSLHYQTDLYTNIGVLISLLLVRHLDMPWIDILVAVVIIVYIITTSIKIAWQALDVLMDRELPDTIRNQIFAIASDHPKVISVHDLRTRTSGTHLFIQMHLEMEGNLSLQEAHDAGFTVAEKIRQLFPNADIIIHHDPIKKKL